MYAPNTYNGGYEENLSSISAKSETYSNVSPDYNVSSVQVILCISISVICMNDELKKNNTCVLFNIYLKNGLRGLGTYLICK